MNNNDSSVKVTKGYREPWFWFVLAPLFIVVVVTSLLITIAVKRSDDVVKDDYYKEGRLINWRLNQDRLAEQLKLKANIVFDQASGDLIIDLPEAVTIGELSLELSHPSKEVLDHQYELQSVGKGRYRADLTQILNHRWYLLLSGLDSEQQPWRLKGEIDFGFDESVRLSPP